MQKMKLYDTTDLDKLKAHLKIALALFFLVGLLLILKS